MLLDELIYGHISSIEHYTLHQYKLIMNRNQRKLIAEKVLQYHSSQPAASGSQFSREKVKLMQAKYIAKRLAQSIDQDQIALELKITPGRVSQIWNKHLESLQIEVAEETDFLVMHSDFIHYQAIFESSLPERFDRTKNDSNIYINRVTQVMWYGFMLDKGK